MNTDNSVKATRSGDGNWVEVGQEGKMGDICNNVNNKIFFNIQIDQSNLLDMS